LYVTTLEGFTPGASLFTFDIAADTAPPPVLTVEVVAAVDAAFEQPCASKLMLPKTASPIETWA
jgi:hypothetical protein